MIGYWIFKNKKKGAILADRGEVAKDFTSRGLGLLGRKEFPSGSGLFLTPCSSVHMFFMKFPIDLVYVDKNMRVVKIVRNLKPWRISFGGFKARSVFEFPSGTINDQNVEIGDIIEIVPTGEDKLR